MSNRAQRRRVAKLVAELIARHAVAPGEVS